MNYHEYERMQELASAGDHVPEFMQAIFDEWAPSYATLASLQRRVYKETDAGISVSFELDDGTHVWSGDLNGSNTSLVPRVRRIGFSSIVEDSEREVPLRWLDLLDDKWNTPEKVVAEFGRLVEQTNQEACSIWDEEHSLEINATHVDKLLTYLQKGGFTITAVDDGQDVTTVNPYLNPDTARAIAVDAITAVDVAWLRIVKGGETATLFLVLDNEPECLVCDYTYGHKFDAELDTCVDNYSDSLDSHYD